jgi:hypothetical protein
MTTHNNTQILKANKEEGNRFKQSEAKAEKPDDSFIFTAEEIAATFMTAEEIVATLSHRPLIRAFVNYSKVEFIEVEKLRKIIKKFPNWYPKDIFNWDNKEKLDFNRGRFNQHCYEIVENLREALLKELDRGKE